VGGSRRGRWLKAPEKIHLSVLQPAAAAAGSAPNSNLPLHIPNDATAPSHLLLET